MAIADLLSKFEDGKIEDFVMDPILTTNLPMLYTLQGLDVTVRARRQTYTKDI